MKPKNRKPFRVVVADPLHSTGWALLKAAPDVIVEGPFDCSADLQTVLLDADALLICSDTKVDTNLLDAAPLLKVIARAGSRLDNVDIDEAARRGIFVIHVPEANLVAVVEYTFLLMLMLARRLSPHSNRRPCGDGVFGFELAHKTLGIIGFGHQGREVAARAQAFGMHVLAYDPYVDLSFAREQRVEIVGLSELLARGDIISLHTDYTPQTHHIIDADAFSKMKPGVYLINSLHADLVDRVALMAALENGALGGVALDRWETGALEDESPFTNQTKVLILDNQGQATLEAQSNTAKAVVSDMLAALRREDYRNVVNLPFTQAHSYQAVKPYMDLAVKLGKLQGQLADGWITRVEVELLGEGLQDLVRPVAAILLSGMIRRVDERPVNWISAPVLAYEQGIATSQAKELVLQGVYPAMIACRVSWEEGQRTVAGALFGTGEVRLVSYDDFAVDAHPDGYVLILENDDVPGVIGKVGTRLSQEKINIAQWRYGRDFIGGRGVSFINLDNRVPDAILEELEREVEIHHAQLVRL
jgi:D-3-phosphoglycerate dehydrogenase